MAGKTCPLKILPLLSIKPHSKLVQQSFRSRQFHRKFPQNSLPGTTRTRVYILKLKTVFVCLKTYSWKIFGHLHQGCVYFETRVGKGSPRFSIFLLWSESPFPPTIVHISLKKSLVIIGAAFEISWIGPPILSDLFYFEFLNEINKNIFETPCPISVKKIMNFAQL